MFPTISSASSSSKSGGSSLRVRNPLPPKTSYNPLCRAAAAPPAGDAHLTSFDASHFVFRAERGVVLRRYRSHGEGDGGGGGTPDSTGSRGSRGEAREAREFLERYSLPRVVRVGEGEPVLLYRCFDSFTKVGARAVGRRGEGRALHFPEGYSGWFSLTNEKGEKSAVVYSTILQLVREQVCSFICMQPFTAYASQTNDLSDGKAQYLKTQVRAGQLFQLRAVFQHKDRSDGRNSTRSSRISRSARDKDLSNRYAQLVSQNNQELYVPLTAKGEFYEIHSSMKAKLCFPGMLDKTGPLALDKDCLYKITHLLRRVALPIRVKLIAGPLPAPLPKDFTDTFILENKYQEPLLVTCTLPPPNQDKILHEIDSISINSNLKLSKCTLGFDSETRLFKSQRLQAALAHCHKNVEAWYRQVRLGPNEAAPHCPQCRTRLTDAICANCQPAAASGRQLITKEALEKFPKPKKWYTHFKLLGRGAEPRLEAPPEAGDERARSIDRYKDMSKLIEETFAKRGANPVKKSASFMFSTKRIDLEAGEPPNAALLKCQSLDTQLHAAVESARGSVRSYDFQMCLLAVEEGEEAKRAKPDLIPTLTKPSYITERLCDEFRVKTKLPKRKGGAEAAVVGEKEEEVPYSEVADGVRARGARDENIYAEICEEGEQCGGCGRRGGCACQRTKKEYCYVKLGSNGDSVTQSDSDEAIYNTLR